MLFRVPTTRLFLEDMNQYFLRLLDNIIHLLNWCSFFISISHELVILLF